MNCCAGHRRLRTGRGYVRGFQSPGDGWPTGHGPQGGESGCRRKLDEAKKLADDVTPAGKPDPAAKTGPMAVQNDFEIDTLMQVFKPERGGGLEWEKKLQMLRDKRAAYTASDYQIMVPPDVPHRGRRRNPRKRSPRLRWARRPRPNGTNSRKKWGPRP